MKSQCFFLKPIGFFIIFKFFFCFWALATLPLLAFTQNKNLNLLHQSRIIISTNVEIMISSGEHSLGVLALREPFQEIEKIDRLMSNYRSDSEVSELNHQAGQKVCRVSAATLTLIERAIYFSHLAGGVFGITIAPLLRLWNFQSPTIPAAEDLKKALKKSAIKKSKLTALFQKFISLNPGWPLT